MSRSLGEKPKKRFPIVLPDDVMAGRLHRHAIAKGVTRNDVAVKAIEAYLESESSENLGTLSPEVATELSRFCEAHFGADKNRVIEAAVLSFVRSELIRDAATRERYQAVLVNNWGAMLPFKSSSEDRAKTEKGSEP